MPSSESGFRALTELPPKVSAGQKLLCFYRSDSILLSEQYFIRKTSIYFSLITARQVKGTASRFADFEKLNLNVLSSSFVSNPC